jgi:hypothetical protein
MLPGPGGGGKGAAAAAAAATSGTTSVAASEAAGMWGVPSSMAANANSAISVAQRCGLVCLCQRGRKPLTPQRCWAAQCVEVLSLGAITAAGTEKEWGRLVQGFHPVKPAFHLQTCPPELILSAFVSSKHPSTPQDGFGRLGGMPDG